MGCLCCLVDVYSWFTPSDSEAVHSRKGRLTLRLDFTYTTGCEPNVHTH